MSIKSDIEKYESGDMEGLIEAGYSDIEDFCDSLIAEVGRLEANWLSEQKQRLAQLQYTTGNMASYLGHTEGLFGMVLAGHHWVDGADYCYWLKDKSLRDFTEQECIDTLSHIHKWLQETHKSTTHFVR